MSSQSKLKQFFIELSAARALLVQNGYEPIPVKAKTKYPKIEGWPRGDMTFERIVALTHKYRDHLSTGLRTGRLVGVDIDLHDPEHATAISNITFEILGPTRLRRRGSKGAMLVYRNLNDPIEKLVIKEPIPRDENGERLRAPDGSSIGAKTLVEIFGQGGQFVAYGLHPTTHRPYQWLEDGFEPALVPFVDLPGVTTEALKALDARLRLELPVLGYTVTSEQPRQACTRSGPLQAGRLKDAIDVTEKFLRLIPGRAHYSHSGWINYVCPECRHTDGRSGLFVMADGGFKYSCFHTGCEFNRATGWSPGGGVGERVLRLYSAMGGDPDDLLRKKSVVTRKMSKAEFLEWMLT